MSLTNVWVQTQGDGLVRADQITGIDAHQTPALIGKPSRWLLDIVVSASIGSGTREGWTVTVLHRTLVQTAHDPTPATAALARLLAQLDLISAAGIITTNREATTAGPDPARGADRSGGDSPGGDEVIIGSGQVQFRFAPFRSPQPGHHTGAEYL